MIRPFCKLVILIFIVLYGTLEAEEEFSLTDAMSSEEFRELGLTKLTPQEINKLSDFTRETLEPIINELIKNNNTNFKGVGQPLRICLTGSKFGPGIYDILCSLGKEEVLKRLSQIR